MVVRNRKKGRSLKRVCLPMAPVLLVHPERRFRHVPASGATDILRHWMHLRNIEDPIGTPMSGGGDCGSQECPEGVGISEVVLVALPERFCISGRYLLYVVAERT
jgi:hypothetical protein